MPVRRLDDAGLAAVAVAIADPAVLTRYRAKVATVPGRVSLWCAARIPHKMSRLSPSLPGPARTFAMPRECL